MLFRVLRTSVGSGIVPNERCVISHTLYPHGREYWTIILSPIFIVSSPKEPFGTPFGFTGDFVGEENVGTGSRPCSSLIPVSFKIAPVRLFARSATELKLQDRLFSSIMLFLRKQTYLPFSPTASKFCSLLSRLGVLEAAGILDTAR